MHRIETPADARDLPGEFRHRVEIDVRFADTDAMGHVNNAVYLTYCEAARIQYWTDVTGESVAERHHGAESLILAEARITYRAQVFHTDIVTIESRATRVGTSSFHLEHRLTARDEVSDGPSRLVAVSDSILVRYDYAAERPTPITPEFVTAMEAYEGRALKRP
jgi:acyl-CoA thioester hydrolase